MDLHRRSKTDTLLGTENRVLAGHIDRFSAKDLCLWQRQTGDGSASLPRVTSRLSVRKVSDERHRQKQHADCELSLW
jgi:hypothetical protein